MFSQPETFCNTDPDIVVNDPIFSRNQYVNCNFNVNHVKDNCLEVYVRVNLHFFIDDQCEGLTAAASTQNRLDPNDAFQAAEDLVASANGHHEQVSLNKPWHQAEWGAPVTTEQCVPIRFVLDEVFVHCNTSALQVSTTAEVIGYAANHPNALNIFISSVPGQADGFAVIGSRYAVIENFSPDNFVHEIGHNLTLRHTHRGNNTLADNCLDTWWRPRIGYDADGDGNFEIAPSNRCWDNTEFIDVNNDGILNDLCNPDGTIVINRAPCCDWTYQNNNVMTHGAYKSNPMYGSYTPCQMDIALTELSTDKCDLIETINPGCPPPSAFIGDAKQIDIEGECYFTLPLSSRTLLS